MTTTKERIWAAIHEKHGSNLVLGRTTTDPVFSIADAVEIAATVADMALASTISEHETVTAALLMRVQALTGSLLALVNEVDGATEAYESGMRQLIGHTNYAAIRVRVANSRAALAAGEVKS
jgi:hypothetical protein